MVEIIWKYILRLSEYKIISLWLMILQWVPTELITVQYLAQGVINAPVIHLAIFKVSSFVIEAQKSPEY